MYPPEQDQTTVRSKPSGQSASGRALPRGTRLEEFEIRDLVGEGGFGIVYLAHDHSLERRVAVKEYMPWSLAIRAEGTTTVSVRSESEETFVLGLKSFINEARLLAHFDHPALLKVYRFWEANGTAYMAMPFYEAPTLAQALANRHDRPNEAYLRGLLNPLLDALSELHTTRCYHRDISPDNILITSVGPLLLDFGAARRVISDATQTLTVILKEGYAPIEQYGTSAVMRQGPWTDIYALCGVTRYAITGKKPLSSIDRLVSDHMEPLTHIARGHYSDSFLLAIDAGLAVKPADRPQTTAEFRLMLAPPIASLGPSGSEAGDTKLRPCIQFPDSVEPALPSPALAPPLTPPIDSSESRAAELVPPIEFSEPPASEAEPKLRRLYRFADSTGAAAPTPAPDQGTGLGKSTPDYARSVFAVLGILLMGSVALLVYYYQARSNKQVTAVEHVENISQTYAGSKLKRAAQSNVEPIGEGVSSTPVSQPVAPEISPDRGAKASASPRKGSDEARKAPIAATAVGLRNGFPNVDDYYPDSSRRLAEEGLTVVGVCVGPDGRLTEAPKVSKSSGYEQLDQAAVEVASVGSGHFKPATEGGKPITKCTELPIRFKLHN